MEENEFHQRQPLLDPDESLELEENGGIPSHNNSPRIR